jgi:predicted XRE-type DNA-binding protein
MKTKNSKSTKQKHQQVFIGSGNVFADLGLADPDQRLTKAQLASEISQIIQAAGLTQTQAAKRLGIDQPKVSMLTRGQLKDFSIERLFHFLNRLGQDIEIAIRPSTHRHPSLNVLAKAS